MADLLTALKEAGFMESNVRKALWLTSFYDGDRDPPSGDVVIVAETAREIKKEYRRRRIHRSP